MFHGVRQSALYYIDDGQCNLALALRGRNNSLLYGCRRASALLLPFHPITSVVFVEAGAASLRDFSVVLDRYGVKVESVKCHASLEMSPLYKWVLRLLLQAGVPRSLGG
jgi:hypothetical protein